MPVCQQFEASHGQAIAVRIEQPVAPGRPRLFWDGPARKWSEDPAARVAAAEDPTMPGIYRVLIADEDTRDWPDKIYWAAATMTVNAGDPLGEVTVRPSFGPFWMQGGNDGSAPSPSTDLTMPDGRRLHMWGAYAQ